MLRIDDISYSIAGRPLFEHASASIPSGHKVGLVGPNGTGKTTLFRLLRGELALDGGSISLPSRAKIGGIMAAKRTGELIPMCHPLNLTYADVRFTVTETPPTVRIEAETRTVGPTGVEMEAIVAAQTAAATIYDMCKAVQRDIVISQVRLLHKRGGKSGEFNAQDFKA